MSKWMPIETAPKDGSGFLAFMSKYWIEGMYWNGTDWSYLSDGDYTPHGRHQPTHWMPLPAEPSKDDLWHNTHTCSYSCDRPECIRAQRDELAVRLEAQRDQASGSAEYLAYLEAAVDEAGFVIKHDGGALGDSNFRLEPKTQPAAAWEAVGVDAYDDALDQLWKLAGGNDHPVYKRFLGFRDSFSAPAASPSEINLEQFREAVTYWRDTALQDMQYQNGPLHEQANEGQRLLDLIDAGPKGDD